MPQPYFCEPYRYDAFADILNKYTQLTPWVQAALGIAFFAMIAAVTFMLTCAAVEITRDVRARKQG